jgi:hypothetical protein
MLPIIVVAVVITIADRNLCRNSIIDQIHRFAIGNHPYFVVAVATD